MFSGCCDERTVGKPGLGNVTLTRESVLPGDKHTRPDFSTLVSHEPDGVNPLASGRVTGTCCCMYLDCSTLGAPQLTAALLLLEIPSPPVPVHWHQYRPVSWDNYHVSKGKPFPPVLINSWTPHTPIYAYFLTPSSTEASWTLSLTPDYPLETTNSAPICPRFHLYLPWKSELIAKVKLRR